MSKPIFYFDGSCDLCCYWTSYFHTLTKEEVAYIPFEHPHEKKSPEFISESGEIFLGAHGVALLLSHAPGKSWMLYLYEHSKLIAYLSEFVFHKVSSCRSCAEKASHWIWGSSLESLKTIITPRLVLVCVGIVFVLSFCFFVLDVVCRLISFST